MKLIIPAENNSLTSPVCSSFGRAPLYVSYDTETGDYEFLNNSVATSSQGGAGIKAAQMLVDHGTGAIIACRCGNNAAQVLKAAHIDMYLAQEGSVMNNIERFKNGGLTQLSDIHPGLHNHGGGRA